MLIATFSFYFTKLTDFKTIALCFILFMVWTWWDERSVKTTLYACQFSVSWIFKKSVPTIDIIRDEWNAWTFRTIAKISGGTTIGNNNGKFWRKVFLLCKQLNYPFCHSGFLPNNHGSRKNAATLKNILLKMILLFCRSSFYTVKICW